MKLNCGRILKCTLIANAGSDMIQIAKLKEINPLGLGEYKLHVHHLHETIFLLLFANIENRSSLRYS